MTITTALGFDFGTKRIGVAVGQTLTNTATPLVTLPARNGQPDWIVLRRLVEEWRPEWLVVGVPVREDGEPHSLAAAVKRFAGRLHGRFGLPVALIDERLSSYAAEATANETIDALAACFILESWLSSIDQAVALPR